MPDELLDGTPDTRTWVGTLHHGPHTPDYGLTFIYISFFVLFFQCQVNIYIEILNQWAFTSKKLIRRYDKELFLFSFVSPRFSFSVRSFPGLLVGVWMSDRCI